MRDELDTRMRVVLAAALLATVAGGTADLADDRPSSWLSAHVIFEVLMIAGALVLVSALWLQWWRSERAAAGLRREVEAERAAREAWRASAETALAGFGRAVSDQLARWRLTPAEREVALALLQGQGFKQLAAATGRSERTVRQHAGAVYEKAGLAGRAELAAFFLRDLALPGDDSGEALPPRRSA